MQNILATRLLATLHHAPNDDASPVTMRRRSCHYGGFLLCHNCVRSIEYPSAPIKIDRRAK
ncbi:hypothetical protein K439DRAFT_1637688 [Ramaria rubella]|nr:hypothetical protein K439DRAFT_1637688 [Ramaria rubella]